MTRALSKCITKKERIKPNQIVVQEDKSLLEVHHITIYTTTPCAFNLIRRLLTIIIKNDDYIEISNVYAYVSWKRMVVGKKKLICIKLHLGHA